MDEERTITRRQALQRAAAMLGGALAASTVAGVLAEDGLAWAAVPAPSWAPTTLDARQLELVATLAEHIIPATDTPGARAAGVHRFVDALLTGYYSDAERDRFLAGLRDVDARAQEGGSGKGFLALTRAQQVALLTALDREAYPARGAIAQQAKQEAPAPRDPIVGPSSGPASLPQQSPADAARPAAPTTPATPAARADANSGWFWRRMKELTLAGYYTSQVGATRELRVNPMGVWRGDIPYAPPKRSWS
jgi:hypothetical protein